MKTILVILFLFVVSLSVTITDLAYGAVCSISCLDAPTATPATAPFTPVPNANTLNVTIVNQTQP